MFVSHCAVLQGLRAFCRQQMRQRPQLLRARRLMPGVGPHINDQLAHVFFLQQSVFSRARSTNKATRQQVCQRVHQGGVHGTFFLLGTPAPRLPRQ